MIHEGFGCASIMGGNMELPLSPGLARLKSEHGPLRQQMETFLAQAEKTSSPEDLALLRQQVAAFQRELDPHSEREEQVLFPMMAAHIGREMGPIAVMEYEHQQAKERITRFLQETPETRETEERVRQLTEDVIEAYHILFDHFLKEENVLFPMAEQLLSEEEKEELARRIQEI